MTMLSMTIPAARRSPIVIPRRDIMMSSADDLTLALTLVESDRPDADPVDLAGVGPVVRMVIWYTVEVWDYGWVSCPLNRSGILTVTGTILQDASGQATITIPRGSLSGHGLRLGYGIQLDYDGDLSEIQWGALHVRPVAVVYAQEFDILDSSDVPITNGDDQDIEA